MCFHNHTQHNGCGHFAESHTHPWTLCATALHRLNVLRGPNSPTLSPPTNTFVPPKRSASTRRFFSLSGTLSRSSTSTTTTSRRAVTGPPGALYRSDSTSNYAPTTALNYSTLPDHQLAAVKCAVPSKRTQVSREMDVCKACKRNINDMRSMLQRYDKTGSIRGTAAFERFLKSEREGGGESQGDLTVPLDEGGRGGAVYGARQAVILGHPESAMNAEGPRGLGTLERPGDEKYFLRYERC